MRYEQVLAYARELRINQTQAEEIVWKHLRNRRFHNYKFTRQKIIKYGIYNSTPKYYIVDFYCDYRKLIIEIDGKYHQYQIDADNERTEILNAYGFKVIRFTNREVIGNWKYVEKKIYLTLIGDSF